ncbi:MAG: uracil-DNA glycosylase [Pseudomonadota bacterium]
MSASGDVREAALSALAWQVELGADEAISETPIDRFVESKPKAAPAAGSKSNAAEDPRGRDAATGAAEDARPAPKQQTEAAMETETLAAQANSLEELAGIMQAWEGSPLKAAARNFVFCDGNPKARLIVVGEAPGAEEDIQGKPFVGRAGQLLDRMLAAIGLSRAEEDPKKAAYITNMVNWRPTGNRTPTEKEADLFRPFLERHIQLADPELILTMGNTPTKGLLRTTTGIKRMRGTWVKHESSGKPLLPTFHPAYLLRSPGEKRMAWMDMLAIKKALEGQSPL